MLGSITIGMLSIVCLLALSTAFISFSQQAHADLQFSGGNVYILSVSGGETFLEVSHDGGVTFNPPIQLSDGAGHYQDAVMASSGSNVYVGWIDGSCITPGLYFRASHDNGDTFDPAMQLGRACSSSVSPQILAIDSNVYVVMNNGISPPSVAFTASRDNGTTFDPVIQIASRNGEERFPQLAAAGSNVYVGWADLDLDGRNQVFLRASDDYGANFGPIINLSQASTSEAFDPQLAAAGSNVYVGWGEDLPPIFEVFDEVFFKASHDNGATFSSAFNMSNNAGNSVPSGIAASPDGDVYVSWLDNTSSSVLVVYLKASHDNGATFSPVIDSNTFPKSDSLIHLLSTESEHVDWLNGRLFYDTIHLYEGENTSDLVIDLGYNVMVVADSNDPRVTGVTFRWIDPDGNMDKTVTNPLSGGSTNDTFVPDEFGGWTVEADFGNGVVLQEILNISFNVIPESPLGVLALVGSSIAAFAAFYLRHHKRS